MMTEKNAKANRPKSGTSGEGNGSGGPRVRYQLPPEEASPRGSPGPTGTAYQQQPWTLKKFNVLGDMPEYNNRWSMFFGFIQIGLGVVCFILGIVLIAIHAAEPSAIGIWGGIIFIGSGLVGVFSFRKPLTPLVIACFGLSAASVVVALMMFIMVCYFTNVDDRRKALLTRSIEFWSAGSLDQAMIAKRDAQTPKIAVGVILAIFAIAELVIAVLQSLLVAKVFVVRGPQAVPASENPNRLSASNPVPAGGEAAGGDQSWGEYNPPARTQPAGDQSWGEYNPPAKNKPAGDQQLGEYKPEQKNRQPEPQDGGEQEPSQEWREYKPQKGRKAMREESQKGNAPKRQPTANAGVNLGAEGTVTYNPSEEEPRGGDTSLPVVGGIIRRQATGTVDVEEDEYCPPPRESYADDDDDIDYDRPPPAVSVSVEI
jgi:hypothetical protein